MDSKKLLVFSDTHGKTADLKKVMEWAKGQLPPQGNICAAAFLGDGISDLRRAADATGFYCDWKVISGNNDYDYYTTPEAAAFDFGDYRFYMSHGHLHSLYGGYNSLISAARSNNAQVVLFGHTHVPFCKVIDGITLINPGSVGRPRSRIGASFALVECTPGEQLTVEFMGIGDKNISKLKI
jgi:putative phosphoesterase